MATLAAANDPAEQNDRARTRLHERYREAIDTPLSWNDTLDTILSHRSVRAYLPDAVPEGTIELLVAAAQSAATSSNLQPWSVLAVEDAERKRRLAVLAGNQKHVVDAPLFLLWLVDLNRPRDVAKTGGSEGTALDYLESFLLGAVDTSLAAQSAVLALESLGLGSVYIGGIRNRPAEVAAELGLPPGVFALFGLVVGYPDPAAPASVKPRLAQKAVLFREQYDASGRQAPLGHYNARLRTFQQEQGLPEQDWTTIVANRLKGPEILHGRDRLREILNGLGFALK
ncbi:nitroreductase [Sphingopyxis panaciterrae]|uniref:NADPH-dependent oxidoreductase n=1 Tax=Sphingopyxis panaciterrae TaxID=363841 RepID=UPI001423B2C2|nr:NADPH-dependent oxidoreductase [Sphingopyxis panaciterrae]NIJ37369.1 nitroreductase [Sphingopyxis panaciterrae]